MDFKKAAAALAYLLPAAAAILLYLPALGFEKVWDDWQLLANTELYRDPAQWLAQLARPLPFEANYFRPLVVFTFMLEAWSGASLTVTHAVNILLHAFNSVLVALLARRLWPAMPHARAAAVLAGLMYALYPPLTEVAAWIAGRFDLMLVSFVLLGLLADSGPRRPLPRAVFAGFAFAAALFCKEMAVVMPPVLLAFRLARSDAGLRRFLFAREQLALYVALAVALGMYLGVRIGALGYLMAPIAGLDASIVGSPWNRLLLVGMAFAGYLHMMLLPFMNILPMHFTEFPIRADNALAWAGLVEIALVAALLAWAYRRPQWRFLACGVGAALLSLAPVLHLVPMPNVLGNFWMADRFLALPLALFLLGLGPLFARAMQPAAVRLASVVAAAWLGLAAMLVHVITPLWQNNLTLWHWLTEDVPQCSQCHMNFSNALLEFGFADNALKEADRALQTATKPWQLAMGHGVRANALGTLGRQEDALKEIDAGQAAAPSGKFEVQRAGLLVALGRDEEARAALQRAKETDGYTAATLGLIERLERRLQRNK